MRRQELAAGDQLVGEGPGESEQLADLSDGADEAALGGWGVHLEHAVAGRAQKSVSPAPFFAAPAVCEFRTYG